MENISVLWIGLGFAAIMAGLALLLVGFITRQNTLDHFEIPQAQREAIHGKNMFVFALGVVSTLFGLFGVAHGFLDGKRPVMREVLALAAYAYIVIPLLIHFYQSGKKREALAASLGIMLESDIISIKQKNRATMRKDVLKAIIGLVFFLYILFFK